jgi:hypothetical protein
MYNIKIDTIKNVIIFGLTALLIMVTTYAIFRDIETTRIINLQEKKIQNLLKEAKIDVKVEGKGEN